MIILRGLIWFFIFKSVSFSAVLPKLFYTQLRLCANLRVPCASYTVALIQVRRYLLMYFTPETLLNHVFEDLRKPKAPNIRITLTISWSSHLVLPRLRTWFTMVFSWLYIACGSSPLLRMNRPSSPSIVSRLVILVTSSPSCAVLRTSQISLALFNPCTLLYSS
jgi:hypothetical protein